MKTIKACFCLLLLCDGHLSAQLTSITPVTPATAVTYQGRLNDGGAPANGLYDFAFSIFNANGLFRLAGPMTNSAVPVSNGLFTAQLNFDPDLWVGGGSNARLLAVEVRSAGSENFVALTPLQPITAVPFALRTLDVSGSSLSAPDGSPSSAVLVDNDGDVGIGTIDPQAALQVSGNNSQLRLHDPGRGNHWNIYTENHPSQAVSGNLLFVPGPSGVFGFIERSTGNYFSGSDARLKTNIRRLAGVLDRVLQLRPVSYTFTSGPTGPRTLGLIAQEVEQLFPEAVSEHGGTKALSYSELVPVTVGAIQELNSKFEAESRTSEARVQQLEAENAALKRSVEELKTLVDGLARRLDGESEK